MHLHRYDLDSLQLFNILWREANLVNHEAKGYSTYFPLAPRLYDDFKNGPFSLRGKVLRYGPFEVSEFFYRDVDGQQVLEPLVVINAQGAITYLK